MNTTKQFWALVKFQTAANPYMLLMAPALAAPLYFIYFGTSTIGENYHPTLDLFLSNSNMFVIGIIAVSILAPEVIQSDAVAAKWASGTEFMLTRAVDRKLVLRARAFLFYLMVLIVPLGLLVAACFQPALLVGEFEKASRALILERLPGCTTTPADRYGVSANIMIPHGNMLVATWRLFLYAITTVALQTIIFLIYSFRHRRFIALGLYVGIIFGPLIGILTRPMRKEESVSTMETLFLSFAAHPIAILVLTALVVILCQLWCERRFAQLEQ